MDFTISFQNEQVLYEQNIKCSVKEYEFNYAFKEQNCFFTAKACDEHIAKNHYHYKEPCSFGNTFWRNPEMQLIANFLVELAKFSNKKEEHDDN